MPDAGAVANTVAKLVPGAPSAGVEALATLAPPRKAAKRSHGDSVLYAILAVALLAAVVIARSGLYTAASDTGYWIGVAGGVAMLVLLLYPLRKRWRVTARWGAMRWWFAVHMWLGIVGPLLIVAHSTLRFGSVNATVAFVAMTLMTLSGIVGRYLYAQIHNGLYGRKATLEEIRGAAGLDSAEVHSKLAFAPAVERRLVEFAKHVETVGSEGMKKPWRFLLLGYAVRRQRREFTSELVKILERRAQIRGWSERKLRKHVRRRTAIVGDYLGAVQRLAQFTVFEDLFSWWHVLHVPVLYMLLASAIAHVVAVHMY